MSYDLIIFDCDGVLIDSEWLSNQVEVEALGHLGHSISMEEYLELALGRSNDEVGEKLLHQHGVHLPKGFWQEVKEKQRQVFTRKLTPIAGVKEVIESLRMPCCVASGSHTERLTLTLTLTGLFPLLEGRIFGRECAQRGKPAPDIFLYAAQQMSIAPARCLVIEDSIHGIQAAKAAGMEVWGFCGARHITPRIREQLLGSGVRLFEAMQAVQAALSGTF
jgi:HAD superfamily hydrolase (TIGR01509 family)